MTRHAGRFLVMRYSPFAGPMIAGRRTSVAHYAFSLAGALAWLSHRGPGDNRMWWIAAADAPAHRRPRR